ncbi:MAG: oxidoreductase [Pikeienuella sp.]|uniref:oxidoreductase n=1 Tax=Pikeienuella sp. TaxID=2831957 RepID=UPI003918A576
MRQRLLYARTVVASAAFALAALSAAADDGERLTIIPEPGAAPVELDRAALEAMPVTMIETSTIWTEGVRTFTGVLLADLVASQGIRSEMISAVALNDYAVEIPLSDAEPGGPIVAYMLDGAAMSVREKGPFWIIYPYDSDAKYRTETIYSRSIWQLTRIEAIE